MAEDRLERMDGLEASGPDDGQGRPLFTEDEERILRVYDRLEELQFEIALLKANGVLSQGDSELGDVTDEALASAQKELLDAKATYQVRSSVIENVLLANPALRAVHAGSNASLVEQDLLPLLRQRDALSITLAQVSNEVLTARAELRQVEHENIVMARENAELAKAMLALADEVNTQKKENITDPALRERLSDLEMDMKDSRRKWRIIKGTASAVITGSGVDWARDPVLVDIVLDNEG